MKSFRVWRVVGVSLLVLLGLLAVLVGTGWLLLTRYGRPFAKQQIREQLTRNSELQLDPFEVDFTIWRDFPYVTASISNVVLSDTSQHRSLHVMRVGRADLRLDLRDLLHRQVHVTRLTVHDLAIGQLVDSTGHRWGLRGKRHPTAAKAPGVQLDLDSVIIYNFGIYTRNDYTHSALQGRVYRARLMADIQQGVLHVQGDLVGRLNHLSNRNGDLLTNEPMQSWLSYQYSFARRKGTFGPSSATLNGDTIRLSGTHQADTVAAEPRGTFLDLRFAGSQPLLAVLRAALPPTARYWLAGASSASKAQLVYTISGLSGPLVRPHTVMRFGLRNASVQWPDSARRIDRWDLQGTYDNGPAHLPKTMSVTLSECRIHSPVGQLDAALVLRDFRQPFIDGRIHGRTALPALVALLSPGRWGARRGTADLNVHLRGQLPAMSQLRRGEMRHHMSIKGMATLRDADFALSERRGELRHFNVRIGLNDSLWQLDNASGVVSGMRFRATATTVHLLDFITGQSPTASVAGSAAVDVLDIGRLRELARATTNPLTHQLRRARRSAAARQQLVATLGTHLLPEGLHLDLALRCGQLALGLDTLRDLAARVRHNGEEVRLTSIAGRLWGGRVSGEAHWPTDSTKRVAPVDYNMAFVFDTLSYSSLLTRLTRPPRRSVKSPASPAVRELLLASNGHLRYEVNALRLPDGERLRHLHMRLDKQDNILRLPYLHFDTPQGGTGDGSAAVELAGMHIVAADAKLALHYDKLDVPQLLRMLASVAPPRPDSATVAAARAARVARRAARNGGTAPSSVVATGRYSAVLRIEAGQVSYAAVHGRNFRATSRLQAGEALLDECSVDALGGRVSLKGRLITDAGRQHHPLQAQALLEDIQLPELFDTFNNMRLNVLGPENIRGGVRCAVALRTDLDGRFLPALNHTSAYLHADIRDLELLDVEALQDALKVQRKRTAHLLFEPVSSDFVLNQGELLIPNLRLNSNLTEMQLSGRYYLDGGADLFLGFNPLNALFGNNDKRIDRIEAGEPTMRRPSRLTYVHLAREQARTKFRVGLFQHKEQLQQQAQIRQQTRRLVITQRLDTTLRLPPANPLMVPQAKVVNR